MKLATGYVLSSFAADGRLKIRSYSGEYAHLRRLRTVILRKESAEHRFSVIDVRLQGAGAILRLKGVDTLDVADALRGWQIVVPRRLACRRRRNEYYVSDLCGCSVRQRRRTVGVIRSVWNSGNEDMLEVENSSGAIYTVPFRRKIIVRVDTMRRSIDLDAEWVL